MTFELLGFRFRLQATWILVLALIVLSLAALGGGVDPAQPDDPLRWILGVGVAALFFISVLLHELAHAFAARRQGVEVGEITLLVFGGNPRLGREAAGPRAEAVTALAGPLASLLLGGALLGGWLLTRETAGVAGLLLSSLLWWAGMSNVLLGSLNLVPAFPFDGLRLLRALLWRLSGDFLRATRLATYVARAAAYGLIALGLALALGDELIIGIWLALIGWLLGQAAEGAYRRVEFSTLIEDMLVRDVMESQVAVVGPNLTIDTLVQQHQLGGRDSLYPVTMDGLLVGTVDMAQIRGVPRAAWPTTRVTDVMKRGERMSTLTEELTLPDAVRRLEETGAPALPVVAEDDGRRLLGMITRESLRRAIRQRAALRQGDA